LKSRTRNVEGESEKMGRWVGMPDAYAQSGQRRSIKSERDSSTQQKPPQQQGVPKSSKRIISTGGKRHRAGVQTGKT